MPNTLKRLIAGSSKQSTLLHLLGLGLLSEILYLAIFVEPFWLPQSYAQPKMDLGKLTNYDPAAAVGVAVGVIFLFGLYSLAIRTAPKLHSRAGQWAIWGLAGIFAVSLVFVYPVTAGDVFDYIAHARVALQYEANPFVVPPQTFPQDPFFSYVIWPDVPSVYGPLWMLLSLPLVWLGNQSLLANLFLFKSTNLVAYLGSALLVDRLLCELWPERRLQGLVAYSWNPLLLFEALANVHNDIWMVLLMLLALWAMLRNRVLWAIPLLVASALIKFTTLLLLPVILLWQVRRAEPTRSVVIQLAAGLAMGFILTLLAYAPVWQEGAVLDTLRSRGGFYTTSLVALAAWGLRDTFDPAVVAGVGQAITLVLFATVYLAILVKTGASVVDLLHTSVLVFLAYLALTAWWFQPWYLLWPLAIAVLLRTKSLQHLTLLLTLTAMLSYLVYIYLWVWNAGWLPFFTMQALALALIYGGPLIWLWFAQRMQRAKFPLSN